MLKSTITVACALGLAMCLLQTALGCECQLISVGDAFTGADVVFVGKVIKITRMEEASIGMRYKPGLQNPPWEKFVDKVRGVTLEVSEPFKGVTRDTVEVISGYAGPGSCGVEFKEGESYLVYAYNRRSLLPEDATKLPKKSWTQEMRLKAEVDELNAKLPAVATNYCSRTERLSSSGGDVDEIRRIIKR